MKLALAGILLTGTLCINMSAQTTYTMAWFGECDSANACGPENYPEVTTGEPAEAQQPEPMFYPSLLAVYDTGLQIPVSFHTGNAHPQIPTPQVGTGCQVQACTFHWYDGGGHDGIITLNSLSCVFNQSTPWNYYSVTCNGTDVAGNNVTFTHFVYLIGPLHFGYWNWRDGHGPVDVTIEPSTNIIAGPDC